MAKPNKDTHALKEKDKVKYQGKAASVVNPNFAGKGTVEIRPYGQEDTVIVHTFEITPEPVDKKVTPEGPTAQSANPQVTAPDGETTIPANVQKTEGKTK